MTQPSLAMEQDGVTLEELVYNLFRNHWAGGNIMRGELPAYPTLAALPTASADYRYRTVVVTGGAGVADVVYVCRKTTADTYAWVDISTPVTLTAGSSTSDLKDDLVTNGIVTDGGATPLNLDGGALTVGTVSATGIVTGGNFQHTGNAGSTGIGFFNTTPAVKQTVTGSRGSNAALASLLTALAGYGIIVDSSS